MKGTALIPPLLIHKLIETLSSRQNYLTIQIVYFKYTKLKRFTESFIYDDFSYSRICLRKTLGIIIRIFVY